ncbi:hypothetical protein K0U83_26240 [bacterium]|nr:hypothetical protein [bacterium]
MTRNRRLEITPAALDLFGALRASVKTSETRALADAEPAALHFLNEALSTRHMPAKAWSRMLLASYSIAKTSRRSGGYSTHKAHVRAAFDHLDSNPEVFGTDIAPLR